MSEPKIAPPIGMQLDIKIGDGLYIGRTKIKCVKWNEPVEWKLKDVVDTIDKQDIIRQMAEHVKSGKDISIDNVKVKVKRQLLWTNVCMKCDYCFLGMLKENYKYICDNLACMIEERFDGEDVIFERVEPKEMYFREEDE